MKSSSFRRKAAGIALIGAGAMALLAGPASAHTHNGNSASITDPVNGRHDVSVKSGAVEKTVSLVRSKADGCSFNTSTGGFSFGVPCATPSIVDVSSPNFTGTPGQGVTALLCNGKVAAGTDQGGDDDPIHGCDAANGRGLSSVPGFPASSGTFTLDGAGDLTGGVGGVPASGNIPLTLTSCNGNTGSLVPDLLTQLTGPICTNSVATATCPPTQGQILNGFPCIVPLAEFDPVALTSGAHVGFRVFNMKSPIPTKLCGPAGVPNHLGAVGVCPASITANTTMQLTGVRFPCRINRPDDPGTPGAQGACIAAWNTKTILTKPSTGSPPLLSNTVVSQSASNNGDYTIRFNLANNSSPGVLWKIVPHAPTCVYNQGNSGYATPNDWLVNSCESGNFNAAGVAYKQL